MIEFLIVNSRCELEENKPEYFDNADYEWTKDPFNIAKLPHNKGSIELFLKFQNTHHQILQILLGYNLKIS